MDAGPPLAPTPELPPELGPLESGDPRVVGPYRLVGRIGAGGMGAVYGALDGQGSCVAVKTVHAGFARKSSSREAFAREVEMLGRAGGISTARLHDADPEAAVPWLAFDYVPGRDLRTHVRAFGPLEGDMLRTFALGIAEGLLALHAAGIAHRDIKPGNVILSPQGPKIVDFGIAVRIGTERSSDASASYGTPGWVAPERYSGAAADPSADVFAWGGLVTLAATGHQPFGTGDAGELASRVREGAYDIDGVPEDLLGLVEAALSVAPGRRPSSEVLVRELLPEPAEGTEGRVAPPQTATDSLRRMLHDYWRGVDDAGHEPGRWAAALGVASAAGLGATALGSSALGSGGASGAGAAGTTAGGATTAAGGGATGTGLTTGGALSGVATSKLGLAGAGLLAVAGLGAGGFVVHDQVSENPSETVAAAVSVLEEGSGFTAQVERVPVNGGETVTEEYLYSADTDSFLLTGQAMGQETVAVANHGGELYVYAPRAGSISWGNWNASAEPLEIEAGVSEDSVSLDLVTGPLRALAESGEAEGTDEEGVYSGPTTLEVLDEGILTSAEAEGRAEIDEDDAPVWVDYTTERWEVHVEFTGTDEEVTVEDPQISSLQDGIGWAAVHAPVCGSVTAVEREWQVRASGWEVDCAYAMELAQMMSETETYGENADPERVQHLAGHSGSGGSTWLVDEAMACSLFRHEPGGNIANRTFLLSACQPAEVLSEGTQERPYDEVEFEGRTLIDFHEQP
ncbi:serine/threonine-protein kinase [Nocardiopsis xinjiangensis]|uniref:serine/threonine-protein kinase n=1 Tax=Nocardiopsis xinjiangensis TaxID=124285 RepID=UPI000348017C|nr:serine/threonine-protein kinase [Nocardiopsis xinjiangensis]